MQDYWKSSHLPHFDDEICDVQVSPVGNFKVEGRLQPHQRPNSKIHFLAANPIDRRDSYVGSGLPFPNPEIAYENTPNRGVTHAVNGGYSFFVHMPNSFYTDLGKTLLPPHVLIRVCGDTRQETDVVVLNKHFSFPEKYLTSAANSYTRASFSDKHWDTQDLKRFEM